MIKDETFTFMIISNFYICKFFHFAGTATIGQTKQKFHQTFGTNHVAPFLLTYLLLDLLKKSAPSRIVNVSSTSHYTYDSRSTSFLQYYWHQT